MVKEKCNKCNKGFKSLAHGVCAYCNPEAYYKYYNHLTEPKRNVR